MAWGDVVVSEDDVLTADAREGYVAVNRLTGAYLAEHHELRVLKAWVQKKGRVGTWVDIYWHTRNGGKHHKAGFYVDGKHKGRKAS